MHTTDEAANKSTLSLSQDKETMEYKVRNQDTLCKIAVNYNTTMCYLRKLNKLSSTMIFPGQILRVPLMKVNNDEDVSISDEELSLSFASDIENAYAFLSPLSLSQNENNCSSTKPFKDLCVVSSDDQKSRLDQKQCSKRTSSLRSEKTPGLENLETLKIPILTSTSADEVKHSDDKITRERLASIESLSSEPFEENFLKLNVYYINDTMEHVRGILLITPVSAMFDPDPSCPKAKEHGCEKYGMMCDVVNIISLTMYREAQETGDEKSPISNKKNLSVDLNDENSSSPDTPAADRFALEPDSDTLEGDGSNSLKKVDATNLEITKDLQLSTSLDADGSSSGCSPESEFLYFCIRSSQPMMKTFSVLSALTNDAENVTEEKNVKEAWFHVPRRNSDQLLAAFMQWNPDPYALDFAEQNGFLAADLLEGKRKKKTRKVKEKRSRSSTSTTSSTCTTSSSCSSDFTVSLEHETVGDKKLKKEWELVSVEEAKRRTGLNANELANDDTSLIPELRHQSNLLNDHTLLELCRRMPARCIGCPWKLLYSTFEHGMSLRTLYRRMDLRDSDEHPVFIIVHDTEGCIFGAFLSSSPHMSDHFYGSGESFLFTLEPEIEFFDWTGENNFFIKGGSDALVVGGGDGSAGLWIDGDLHHGRSHPCLTFNNPVLSLTEDFLVQDVEVWGFDDNY